MARTSEHTVYGKTTYNPITGEVPLQEITQQHNLGLLARRVVEEDEISDNIILSVN